MAGRIYSEQAQAEFLTPDAAVIYSEQVQVSYAPDGIGRIYSEQAQVMYVPAALARLWSYQVQVEYTFAPPATEPDLLQGERIRRHIGLQSTVSGVTRGPGQIPPWS